MATFHLRIVTPDRLIFDGMAQSVRVRTDEGDICIMAGHIDYMSTLNIGEARLVDEQGNARLAACNGGMITVTGGEACIAAVTFEWADEIDVERAQKAMESAQERLTGLDREDAAFAAADAKLRRALTRISVGG